MAVWRTISRWPAYEVSDDGRVRNLRGRELYIDTDRVGYLRVKLRRDGVNKNRRIHVLVAQAFLKWYPGCDVNHLDRDKTNNRLSNLEITTHSENMLHRYATPPVPLYEEPPF